MVKYFSEVITSTPLNPKLNLTDQIIDRITQLREALTADDELRLPPTRDLAGMFKTCHVTVHRALRELKEQEIIQVKGSRGTFLLPVPKGPVPNINPFSAVGEGAAGYMRLADQLPDLSVAVLEMSSEANLGKISDGMYKAVYSRSRGKIAGIRSEQALSEELMKKLARKGVHAAAENIFIPSRGTALKAVAGAMLRRGDLVVMETEEDSGPYALFRSLGCEVAVAGTVERDGMNMEGLGKICRRRQVRAVFIRPDSSWPFGTVTSNKNRDQLIALSKVYNFRIIAYEYESEYAIVNLPPRLSVKKHEGRVVFVSVLSRASRLWESSGYVVAEPRLIEVLRENDALLDGPRCRSFDQIAAIMHQNGKLMGHSQKLSNGHENRMRKITSRLEARLKGMATVIRPECGRFIVLQFHKPVSVGHIELLSNNLNMNYYERNKHLKENQTVSSLRIEYTIYKEAEWDAFIHELINLNTKKGNYEKSIALVEPQRF